MAFDMTQRSLWTFPAFRSLMDDDDFMTPVSTNSGLTVSEDDTHVFVKAAIPGIDPKDVEITFDKGMLWIKGDAKNEEKDSKQKIYKQMTSSFSYRVAVPGELDQTKEPEASYEHGVMTVAFAKLPQSQPKKITVKTSK